MAKVPAEAFYGEWAGHRVEHLRAVVRLACAGRARVWLLGDSTLDNKFWVGGLRAAAANGYAQALHPPRARRDVCHALNAALERRGGGAVAVNCAVEESTLRARAAALLPQDAFAAQEIAAGDVVVVSVGGNDVALRPSLSTVLSVLAAVAFAGAAQPGPHAWGVAHLVRLFGVQVEEYVRRVIADTRPRAIVVCMLYFLDEDDSVSSWAGPVLAALGYNRAPHRLQNVMVAVYEYAVKTISIEGVTVVPCPLFEAMDGKDSSLYTARVEPSAAGGEAVAEKILSCLDTAGVQL